MSLNLYTYTAIKDGVYAYNEAYTVAIGKGEIGNKFGRMAAAIQTYSMVLIKELNNFGSCVSKECISDGDVPIAWLLHARLTVLSLTSGVPIEVATAAKVLLEGLTGWMDAAQ